MGDDPVGSVPETATVLRKLEFLVVQDIFLTETAKIADVVLPAAGFTEKTGTVTNLERRLLQINKAEEPIGESKPDWWIVQELARRMGVSMNYGGPADIMKDIRMNNAAYRHLTPGQCWASELSPLEGMNADLSLRTGGTLKSEVVSSGRLLFSSGTMITRSEEMSIMARARNIQSGNR